jgi:hypothetical protein
MNDVLIREGLFADEAKALLSTWQQAYFVSPGLCVFYTVPREWTDYHLTLTISGNVQITRVMIGRVELRGYAFFKGLAVAFAASGVPTANGVAIDALKYSGFELLRRG